METSCAAVFLYADDVILLAPSVHALQLLVNICDCELKFLDMAIFLLGMIQQYCLRLNKMIKIR